MGKDDIYYVLGSDNSRVADRLRHAAIIEGVGEDEAAIIHFRLVPSRQ